MENSQLQLMDDALSVDLMELIKSYSFIESPEITAYFCLTVVLLGDYNEKLISFKENLFNLTAA